MQMISVPSRADICTANSAVSVIDAPLDGTLHESIRSAFSNIHTDNDDITLKLVEGGTLRKYELERIGNSDEMIFALMSLQEYISSVTGVDFTSQVSVKIYGPRKPGMAPHRDSDQPGADESINAVTGIYGQRETGLWIVPRSFKPTAEVGRRDPRFQPALALEFPGSIAGVDSTLRPYRRFVPDHGEVVVIDERRPIGIWRSETMGPVALKHSCYPLTPAASVVCRSYDKSFS